MKVQRSLIITGVVIFSLMLVGAALFSARASNQPDPQPPPLSEAIQLINEPSDWSVVRLYFDDRDHLNQVAGQLDIWEVDIEAGFAIAALPPEKYHWLDVQGYRMEIDAEKTALIQAPMAPLDPRFHYYDDYYPNPNGLYVVDFLSSTNAAFPDLTELVDIGDAWLAGQPGEHDRDIWVLRITNEDPTYGDIADKPVFFLFANIHAREVSLPELTIRYIKYLTSGYDGEGGYGLDPDATWLVNHNVLYVLVMQNPDGHWVNEQNTGAYRRKNMDSDDGCNIPSDWGVDLNRNHSFFWGCCNGSSGSPCSETYRGPSPASEPETQAFQSFFATVVEDQNGDNGDFEIAPASPLTTTGIFLSLHAYSDLVLWPWYLPPNPGPPNAAQLETIGRKFAYFNNYDPTGDIWYTVDGPTDDWTYGKFGVASFTFEVGSPGGSCGGFFPAYECIDGAPGYPRDFWAENKPTFLYAHKIARTPFMTAYGPDAQNLSALPGEVIPGDPVQLLATIEDHRYGGDPLPPIYAAEYFIDAPGEDGTGIPMSPVDGSWGDLSEVVSATLDTTGLGAGQHYILIHGQNDAGDWGPFSAVFVTIFAEYNAELLPDSALNQGNPGETMTYTLQIHNMGYGTDTYDVVVENLWETAFPTTIGPLLGFETAEFDVAVTIPLSATNGESDIALVQITSQGDSNISDTTTLTTTANYYALTLTPAQESGYGIPGASVTYNLEVANMGNTNDSFAVMFSTVWNVIAPTSIGPLGPGGSDTFDVIVEIPINAEPGDSDLTSLTLTSQGDVTKSASADLMTTAGILGPLVSPTEMILYGDPGTDVEYTLVISNAGDDLDNFNIAVSGEVWETSAPATSGFIASGASRAVQVMVSIPEDAQMGDSDTANIEISSDKQYVIPVSADLTTIAGGLYALAVEAPIDTQDASQPGEAVSFQIQITNLGSTTDTYDLDVSSVWSVTLPATVGPLTPGDSATVEVVVDVPPDANLGDLNTTTVSVTSQNDPLVTGQVILTTRLVGQLTFLPVSIKP